MENVALAEVAALLAEPSRAAMCMAMLDGKAWTVTELARVAGVRASTASEHISQLRSAGFVAGVRQGRHSYVRIAEARVAHLIETVAEHAEIRQPQGLRLSARARRLAFARTCYDHLAGTVAVALRDGMLRTGLLDETNGLTLTETGRKTVRELGVRIPENPRRELLRDCLDRTERREHLAGALPSALLTHMLEEGWLTRAPHRAVRVNDSAKRPLRRLGVDLTALT